MKTVVISDSDLFVHPKDRDRALGEGNGNPLQYSGLENPMDRGAWGGAAVIGVAKSGMT